MAKFITDQGKEITFSESITNEGSYWVVDGNKVYKTEDVLVYRALKTDRGTILKSEHRNDFKQIEEDGKIYSIDSGLEYHFNYTSGTLIQYYHTDPIELLRNVIGRSGYGKGGNGEYRHSLLKDMSDAWVKASIDYVKNRVLEEKAKGKGHTIRHLEVMPGIYEKELQYRKQAGIKIEDEEN
tara:strand:+ start:810 stop:1355 length:546 start_codon:yes stop_codon:yes gene_type:complete